MNSSADNPTENVLPAGLDQSSFISAISTSGYPLQGIVAATLLPGFNIIEEWGFVDDETNQHRSLDILAFKPLNRKSDKQCLPGLRLLLECKRSRHPFVFFKQVVDRLFPDFPVVHGIPSDAIHVEGPKQGHGLSMKAPAALGLLEESFVSLPPKCASLAKALPSGSKVELSGNDPFNGVILPLVKALRHTETGRHRPGVKDPLHPTLTLCVAVLDAPMVLVESPDQATSPILTPWVRVIRHESSRDRSGWNQSRFYTIDVVHAGFFRTYIDDHVMPFAELFTERTKVQESLLRHGGRLHNLEAWTWDQIIARPAPQ